MQKLATPNNTASTSHRASTVDPYNYASKRNVKGWMRGGWPPHPLPWISPCHEMVSVGSSVQFATGPREVSSCVNGKLVCLLAL